MSAAVSSYRASFRFIGKHLVNDRIHLHVKIRAERNIGRSDE